MEAIVSHTGVTAPLLRINIDTDAIIPSREMKIVSKKGLGEGLFAAWRYSDPDKRIPNPDFVLNQPAYKDTTILLGGNNFGCGSSREHAAWALAEYGIRVIVSPSFGSIFYLNCIRNGILPIVLDEDFITYIASVVEEDPQTNQLTADLNNQLLIDSNGKYYNFDIAAGHRDMLLNGLDAIAMTLKREDEISSFEQNYYRKHPWLQYRPNS